MCSDYFLMFYHNNHFGFSDTSFPKMSTRINSVPTLPHYTWEIVDTGSNNYLGIGTFFHVYPYIAFSKEENATLSL